MSPPRTSRARYSANTAVKRFAAVIRPDNAPRPFEVRFERSAGKQTQADLTFIATIFTDELGETGSSAVLDGALSGYPAFAARSHEKRSGGEVQP